MASYGVAVKGNKSCLCPVHKEVNPSCMVYPESNSWHCFGCKAGGTVIDLVMAIEKVDFIEACNKLRILAGITDTEVANNAPPPPPDPMLQVIRKTYEPVKEGEIPTEEYLTQTQQNKHAYLRNRGYGDDIWDYFQLGYEPYGYGSKRLMKERIIIPWRDDKGKLVTIQGRAVSDEVKPKYSFWNGSAKIAHCMDYGITYNTFVLEKRWCYLRVLLKCGEHTNMQCSTAVL